MNKTEFINAVAEKSGLSKVDAKKAVEAFVETVSSELKEGGKVALLGFGSFSVAEKSARKGVNPKTKQPIEIPARKSVKFKAGAELTEIIKLISLTLSISKKALRNRNAFFIACRLLYQIIVISFLPTPILWFLQNKPVPLQAK